MSYPLNALRSRGMLAALTHQDAGVLLDRLLKSSKTSDRRPAVYCGFDPTAESLHVGNLLQGIALRHFQMAGFRPILLVGGATGMIGDPSGKSEDRILLSDKVVRRNANNIIHGLSPVLDFTCPNTGAVVYNNAEWHNSMSAIEWMRDVGRHFRVNSMLTRDSVRSRISSDQGISFLEFSYQLFQAYDFLHLYRNHNCVLQVGGSDQWGNIISGCELIRKSIGQDAFGVTLPLLTTASGEKYGKSAGNAIWLDAKKTSVFDFYQYFLRADDRDVGQLLHSFTFFKNDEIQEILDTHKRKPEDRTAQKKLAETVTTMIHGTDALESALSATKLLFGKGISNDCVSASQVMSMAGDAPVFKRSRLDVIGRPLVDVATSIGATKSKGRIHRLVSSCTYYVWGYVQ